jgi:hypothetical protein
MLRRMEALIGRMAAENARPDWTLLAISFLVSAVVVMALRSNFD